MTEENQSKATFCPNCQQPAIRTGNEIACEKCDATFVVTKKQGARVKEIGPIQDHEERISALEGKVGKPDQPQKPESDLPDEPESEDDEI